MMAGRGILTGGALFASSFVAAPAQAQCDAALFRVAAGPVPYRSIRSGYCEGSYAVAVGSPFQIISFTIGTLRYDAAMPELVVTAPLSPASAPLLIRARATSGNLGYQMDGAFVPPASFHWSTSVALRPLRFNRGDFGVYGRRIGATGEQLVPVLVGGGPATAPLLMRLVVPEHLNGPVSYALVRPGSPATWLQVSAGSPNKGDVLNVVLPAGSIDRPALLRIRAKSRSLPAHDVTFERAIGR